MGGIRDCLDTLSTRYRYSLYRPAILSLSSRIAIEKAIPEEMAQMSFCQLIHQPPLRT